MYGFDSRTPPHRQLLCKDFAVLYQIQSYIVLCLIQLFFIISVFLFQWAGQNVIYFELYKSLITIASFDLSSVDVVNLIKLLIVY